MDRPSIPERRNPFCIWLFFWKNLEVKFPDEIFRPDSLESGKSRKKSSVNITPRFFYDLFIKHRKIFVISGISWYPQGDFSNEECCVSGMYHRLNKHWSPPKRYRKPSKQVAYEDCFSQEPPSEDDSYGNDSFVEVGSVAEYVPLAFAFGCRPWSHSRYSSKKKPLYSDCIMPQSDEGAMHNNDRSMRKCFCCMVSPFLQRHSPRWDNRYTNFTEGRKSKKEKGCSSSFSLRRELEWWWTSSQRRDSRQPKWRFAAEWKKSEFRSRNWSYGGDEEGRLCSEKCHSRQYGVDGNPAGESTSPSIAMKLPEKYC